jgi:hypothetical protein
VYVYSVGQVIANNTFSAGYVQVGSMAYIPSPQQGFLVVNSIFIIQIITFTTNKILQYQITPQTPTIVKRSSTSYSFALPLYISNYQGLPANSSVIALIEKNLTAQLISAQKNVNLTINISKVSYGLIVIFIQLNTSTIQNILNGTTIISFFSEFQYGAIISLATGTAGSTLFAGVLGNQNLIVRLVFGTPSVIKENYIFPVWVFYMSGQLANYTITKYVAENLKFYYIAGNQTTPLNYSIINIANGSFKVIIYNLTVNIINSIVSGQGVILVESNVNNTTSQNGTKVQVPTGTIEPSVFAGNINYLSQLFIDIIPHINLWFIVMMVLIALGYFVIKYREQVKKSKPSKGTIALGSYMFIIMIWILLLFMHTSGAI